MNNVNEYNEIIKNLSMELRRLSADSKIGITKEQYDKKIKNINGYNNIRREGLKHNERERRLLVYYHLMEEKVFMRYPGKESTKEYKSGGANRIINPNDFIPDLFSEDKFADKLTLMDLAESLLEYCNSHEKIVGHILATILIRMAFLEGYSINYSDNEISTGLMSMEKEGFELLDAYLIDNNSVEYKIMQKWDKIRVSSEKHTRKMDVSILSFLGYIDLLAQQEDCKYFNRIKSGIYNEYKISFGRINTILTLVNIIDLIQDDKPLGLALSKISSFPIPLKMSKVENVTNGIIKTRIDDELIKRYEFGC